MESLETLRQEIEHIDNKTQTSNDTTIESVRECLEWPLTKLSPELINHTSWKRHVWMILHTLIPRWAFILTTTTQDRDTLVFSLIGSSSYSEQLQLAMAQISLPLLLECIRDHHTSTTATSMDVLDIYTSLLKHYFSSSMVTVYLRQATGFTDRLSFCSLLCSIPSRLSNAYGLQQINGDTTLDRFWYSDSRFYSMLTKHVAGQLSLLCTDQKQDTELGKTMVGAIDMTSELIGKMIRQGYQDICIETIVPIAIQHNTTHVDRCDIWDNLWTLTENVAPVEKIYSGMLGYFNKHVESLRHRSSTNASIRSSIHAMATVLSPVWYSRQGESMDRLENFLAYILKDTSKIRLADDLVLRVMVAMAVHSAGLEPLGSDEITDDCAWKLSLRATHMVDTYLRNVIECWTDPVLIKQASNGERQCMTTLLLILLGYADSDMIEDIEHSTGILQGISSWFRTSDESTAKLAMVVAESMSRRTRNKGGAVLDFGIPMDQRLKDLKELAMVADGLTKVMDDSSLVLQPMNELSTDSDSDDDLLDSTDQYLDPDVLIAPDDEDDEETSDLEPYPMEEESDDDDGDDDGKRDPKKKKARIPVYPSELVTYLKDQEDPEKLEIGLNAAEQIIRQNMDNGTGIAEWAIEIGKRLIDFPESYEIDNYRKLQQSSLAALIVACPKDITRYMIEQVFNQNTSIGQKNILLGAISVAVLELSGWNSYSNKHDKDANLNLDLLDLAPSTELSQPNKSGQLVFSSTRAEAELKRQKGIVRNRLSGLAGPIFFFPLVTSWWEAAQTRLRWMAQDPMLVERFIMTLNVIMQCASNTPDRKKIVKEYFDYALSLRFIPKLSTRILRSLLLGVNTILHICYKNQGYLLLTGYTMELAGTEKWLEDILEMHQEKELQQLAMTLLVSIGHLSKIVSYES